MRLIAILFPLPALADPGHIADVAGHSHWIGLAAAGAAIAIGAWLAGGKAKEKKAEDKEEEQTA